MIDLKSKIEFQEQLARERGGVVEKMARAIADSIGNTPIEEVTFKVTFDDGMEIHGHLKRGE